MEAVFEKRSGYFGAFQVHYNKEENISYGYTQRRQWGQERESLCPIIVIYWSKDLVVLSDCDVKDSKTFQLLNQILPYKIDLVRTKGQWALKTETETFQWIGSQAFSLSKHFGRYDSPKGVVHVLRSKIWVTTSTVPIKVVTVERGYRGGHRRTLVYGIFTYELNKYWREGGWGRRSEWVTCWVRGDDTVARGITTKEEAELIAQRYSVEHQIPYVEYKSLFRHGYGGVGVRFE